MPSLHVKTNWRLAKTSTQRISTRHSAPWSQTTCGKRAVFWKCNTPNPERPTYEVSNGVIYGGSAKARNSSAFPDTKAGHAPWLFRAMGELLLRAETIGWCDF